jgi:peptidoglycan/xylan/chitin deacetylase (PgdA/CDA1 family)
MYHKQVNQLSPIRILEASIHGGLGKGNLGLVMARAGVGKTACLVQIALDDLLRERPVLHVSLDQTMDHVLSWYDALFEDIAAVTDMDDAEVARQMVQRHRMIASFTDHDLWPDRLEKTVEMFAKHLHFRPAAILVDGYPWTSHSQSENAAMIGAFKAYAKLLGAELWMSAQTHRKATGDHPTRLMPPYDAYEELIDVAIFLEPDVDDIAVRLLKDHGAAEPPETHLHLHPDTLRLMDDGEATATRMRPVKLPNSSYTLLSGGARGAEAEFGACAESWGITELNFTFEGRDPERSRGLVVLTEEELAQGAVSQVYLQSKMHRTYPDSAQFRRMLQTIWHQVNTAAEVFAVGVVQEDGTVRGGTGWAVELARHWRKPVWVYDQDKGAWLRWDNGAWSDAGEPTISERRFCGTGTRELNDGGRGAIRDLFRRSFGDKPAWT